MRLLSVRLIVSLFVGVTLVSCFSSYYEVQMEKYSLRKELEHRAEVLSESLAGYAARYLENGSTQELQRFVDRFGNREHLAGLVIYDRRGAVLAVTSGLAGKFSSTPQVMLQAMLESHEEGAFLSLGDVPIHIYAVPLYHQDDVAGGLAIVHDAGFISQQSRRLWLATFLRVLVQGLMIVLTTLLIVRWSIIGPVVRAAQWIRALRMGRIPSGHAVPDWDFLRPLTREVSTFAESLDQARSAAENEARLREAADSLWTAERLAVHVHARLDGSRLFVVSNREPYIHTRRAKSLEVVVPASGLVTGLEPVLRTCDGTWIAHGSGDGDIEAVDKNNRLRVPPEEPRYTLRRVWLSKEEEAGYYYGFSNEGLWPLCHIAHTRPVFRTSDWEQYQAVNLKFAQATLEEMEPTHDPVLLTQDYHFGLLPRLVKLERPDARIAIFWHIPWPNPEAFGICPWQRELLDGLLGADLIGFHVQSHCNNFLQTVDRVLESRIDWEHFSITRLNHLSLVRPFPISVEFSETEPAATSFSDRYRRRAAVLKEISVEAPLLGVGVDRVDYTKGILERFLAIERLLEKYPAYQGRFTFVQIGAPSRTHIKRYHDLLAEVEAESDRINWRFQTGKWRPIIFLKRQHSHAEIDRYYQAADLCLVTSLHDGMNLVAKEFLASRHDEQGVLILSCFTGAARELRDALLINPYDINQTAEAIRTALEMNPEEKKARMQRMRRVVRERNVYRWAGDLIASLCEVRPENEEVEEPLRARASVV